MCSHKSPGLTWRKSSHSTTQANCVEVAHLPGAVAVRDSKDPDGPALAFSAPTFHAFLTTTRRNHGPQC